MLLIFGIRIVPALFCSTKGSLVAPPSPDAFAISYCLKEEIGPTLFGALRALLHQEDDPQQAAMTDDVAITIPCEQGYKIMVTREVCQWLDIPLPEGLALSIKHGIGLEAAIHAQVKNRQPMRP